MAQTTMEAIEPKTEIQFKKFSFNLELAKKITNECYEEFIKELDAASTATTKKRTTMTQTTFKKVPFDLELAKKITNKEVKGRIVTEDGLNARIVCFDMKYGGSKILAVLVDCGDYEIGIRCDLDGTCRDFRKEDKFNLHLEVPTYYRDYSNFVPCKRQICVVRDSEENEWGVLVCAGRNSVGEVVFYGGNGNTYTWKHYLPLSKVTERLIGSNKSYEELIQELDAESNKNE